MTKRNIRPITVESRNLTLSDIEAGIIKLNRRIKELDKIDPTKIKYDDAKVDVITSDIRNTIREIFGPNSPEYDENGYLEIWHGGHYSDEPENILQNKFADGIPHVITILKGLVSRLEEKKTDLDLTNPSTNDLVDFWNGIHPKIISVAKSRYTTQHYSDAVESAFKEINTIVKDIVKRKTGTELDGASLMRTAFTPNNPIIVLDDLSTESGKNIQQGYMEIFAGSMTGIRNPKAHENLSITENRAKHFIYLASLLMIKIDERI